jgi:hypothetical protein
LPEPPADSIRSIASTCIGEYEKRSEEEFSRNEWAKKQKAVFLPLLPDTSVRLFKELQELEITDGKEWPNLHHSWSGNTFSMLQKFAAHPAFQLIHLVRWCLLLSGRNKDPRTGDWQRWSICYSWAKPFLIYQKARKKPVDLRELAAVFKVVEIDDALIGDELLQYNNFHLAFDVLPNQSRKYTESKPEEEKESQIDELPEEDELQIASAACAAS